MSPELIYIIYMKIHLRLNNIKYIFYWITYFIIYINIKYFLNLIYNFIKLNDYFAKVLKKLKYVIKHQSISNINKAS